MNNKQRVWLEIILNIFLFCFLRLLDAAFTSLIGIPIWIISSATGLKFCVITAWIKEIDEDKEKKAQ